MENWSGKITGRGSGCGLIFWSVSYLKEVYDNEGREQYLAYFKKNSQLRAAASKENADRLGFTGCDPKSAVEIIPAMLIIVYGPKQKYEMVEATAGKPIVPGTPQGCLQATGTFELMK